MGDSSKHQFVQLLDEPLRNGLTRPARERGQGYKMVNMGELFAHPRIMDVPMDRVAVSEAEGNKYFLKSGDLLFARQSLVLEGAGKCSIFIGSKEPVTYEGHLIRARMNRQIADPLFYYYFFRSPSGRAAINSIVEQVAAAGIRGSDLSRLYVPHPALADQTAIAHILGTLDDKIELNRRMNETLEAMAQVLFKSWFVDPAQDGLPEDWREGVLGDIANLLCGYAFKSRDWVEKGVPVVKIGSVKPGVVDLNEVSFVSNEVAGEAKRYRLNTADLLIGMTGYVGEVGLVPPTENPPLLNQRVAKFVLERPGTSALSFLYCLTRDTGFKVKVKIRSYGTAQANVSAAGILSIPVIIPPKAMIDKFNLFGEPILKKILMNFAQSRTLSTLRDTLLPKLISGELRIKDAEKFIARRM